MKNTFRNTHVVIKSECQKRRVYLFHEIVLDNLFSTLITGYFYISLLDHWLLFGKIENALSHDQILAGDQNLARL